MDRAGMLGEKVSIPVFVADARRATAVTAKARTLPSRASPIAGGSELK
jgi:hypothetical protein